MFTVRNLDNQTFLIIKKEDAFKTDFPLEVYGFIFKQVSGDEATFTIKTNLKLTEEEEKTLFIETLHEKKAIFKKSKTQK